MIIDLNELFHSIGSDINRSRVLYIQAVARKVSDLDVSSSDKVGVLLSLIDSLVEMDRERFSTLGGDHAR